VGLRRLLVPSYADWLFAALIVWLFVAGSGWEVLLADGDTGWHIRAGEYVLAHLQVPRTDLFSFSRPDAPWCAWEWLSDVLFALAHRAAGLKGVSLLAGATVAACFTVLFRHALARGANFLAALGVCLVAAGASGIHFLARPHVFTLLLLALSMWLLGRDRRAPGGAVWLLVPLAALWANLHAGFVALLASIAVIATAAALERHWDLARRYAALAAACMAATLVNPYGIGLHRHILEYLRSDWIRQAVDEFQSPRFRSESATHFELLLFAGLLAAASLLRRSRTGEALLLIGWAHAALVSVRNVPVFAIVACPILAAEASRWLNASGCPTPSVAAAVGRIGADFAPAARYTSIWPGVFLLVLASVPGHWPRDFPENKFPVRLIERQRSVIEGARVFTSDQWGDYLLYRFWPSQRAFVDGRSDFYGPGIGKLYLRTACGQGDWRAVLERYRIGFVLAPKEWPLANLLGEAGGWRLVDRDGQAVLFERGGEAPCRSLARSGTAANPLKKPPRHAEIVQRNRARHEDREETGWKRGQTGGEGETRASSRMAVALRAVPRRIRARIGPVGAPPRRAAPEGRGPPRPA
jgi:hypothetical protein